MTDLREAAREAHDAGLCILPTNDPATDNPDKSPKAPLGAWEKYQTERSTQVQQDRWYGPRQGIGIVTGTISNGVECFETEGRFQHHDDLVDAILDAGLADLWARLNNGPVEDSPSGGRHWYYRTDNPVESTKLAKALDGETLIETRGEGGYIICAPSNGNTHPTGKPWVRLESSGGWADIPTITADERAALFTVARSFNETPDRPVFEPKTATTSASDGDRPGDEFNAVTTCSDVFAAAGWKLRDRPGHDDGKRSGQKGPTEEWTRPGKDTRDGSSATVWTDGRATIFSTSVDVSPDIDERRRLTPWNLHVQLNYGGDHSTAAKEWRREHPRPDDLTVAEVRAATVPDTSTRLPQSGKPDAVEVAETDDPFEHFGAWRPVDLAEYYKPGWQPEHATLLRRDDGRGMFYRGNVNWAHGASGMGKTLVLLMGCVQEIRAGRHVLWIHYEDPLADKLAHRLKLLGADIGDVLERFHVVTVGSESMQKGIGHARALVAHYSVETVIVDSIGEAIGADGIDVKNDEKFTAWIHQTTRVLAADGCAVVGIDHLPMSDSARLDPIGSFRKKAATTGSMFLVESPTGFSQTQSGYIRLTCAKDRSGAFTKGEVAAIIPIRPSEHSIGWEIRAPDPDALETPQNPARPTRDMEAVSKALEDAEKPPSLRLLMRMVKWGDDRVRVATEVLENDGYIEVGKGARNSTIFKSVKPFRAASDGGET